MDGGTADSSSKPVSPVDTLIDVEELTQDVASQPYTFTYQNGRRYASTDLGHYYMPNDRPEIHRLNEQHFVLTTAKGGSLHDTPLTKRDGFKILDIGCGSGIWCLQMAEDYPDAMIMGMDVSPVQPTSKPANVEWIVPLDMEKEWPFAEDYFDFVHLSLVHGCVADWAAMMGKIVRHLAPGGFVEHQEFSLCRQYTLDLNDQPMPMSDTLSDLPPLLRWGRLMEQAAEKRGRVLQLGPKLASFQHSAGLQDVTEKVYRITTGTWPHDPQQRMLGARNMLSALQGMEGFTTVMFTTALGWSLEDTRAFVEEVKRDLRDDGMRKVMDLHVVYGRKASSGGGAGDEEGTDTREAQRPEEAWKGLLGSWSVQFAGGMLAGAAIASVMAMWLVQRR
ncbi:hypothetical protein LTR36_003468 [Oleoguttula mirabilis]|uniref:S-adenosyl-L-methionine-dependent methyltransferase n=1 Tax=Oleoguttula mirabilis TaxID=1507867 RepID=A0AAV9JJ37_9PEZI|nr:hypothetical protein LTR36_003468 [Oleoguttula mirabilis]